jgi:hypothetical protein
VLSESGQYRFIFSVEQEFELTDWAFYDDIRSVEPLKAQEPRQRNLQLFCHFPGDCAQAGPMM